MAYTMLIAKYTLHLPVRRTRLLYAISPTGFCYTPVRLEAASAVRLSEDAHGLRWVFVRSVHQRHFDALPARNRYT